MMLRAPQIEVMNLDEIEMGWLRIVYHVGQLTGWWNLGEVVSDMCG